MQTPARTVLLAMLLITLSQSALGKLERKGNRCVRTRLAPALVCSQPSRVQPEKESGDNRHDNDLVGDGIDDHSFSVELGPKEPKESQEAQVSDEGEDSDTSESSEAGEEETERRFKVALYLDFDFGHQIVNLTPFPETKKTLRRPMMIVDDFRKGFSVARSFYPSIGIGIASTQVPVELVPLAGREVKTIRYARNLVIAKELSLLEPVPRQASALERWSAGDTLGYYSAGGLKFTAGIYLASLGLSGSVQVKGEFYHHIAKVDHRHALIKISRGRIYSLSVSAGTNVVSLGVDMYDRIASSFSFMVDLRDSGGARAFSHLSRGDVAAVQKMIASEESGVVSWEDGRSSESGILGTAWFGLPILFNLSWSAGRIHDLSRTVYVADGGAERAHYSYFVDQKNLMFFGKNARQTETFYAAVVRSRDAKGKLAGRDTFAQYLWHFSDDIASDTGATSAVATLVAKLGPQFEVLFPRAGHLGYLSIKARVHIDRRHLNTMMKRTRAIGPEKFARRGLTEMFDLLVLADAFNQRQEDKAFTSTMASFGRLMMRNASSLQMALALAGPGVPVDFTVEGERISSYVVTMRTTQTPGEFTKVRRWPIVPSVAGRGRPTHRDVKSYLQ